MIIKISDCASLCVFQKDGIKKLYFSPNIWVEQFETQGQLLVFVTLPLKNTEGKEIQKIFLSTLTEGRDNKSAEFLKLVYGK